MTVYRHHLMFMAGTEIGLGTDVRGIHIISLAAWFTVATRPGTLADGLAEILAARISVLVTLQAVSAAWEGTMLLRSMAYATMKVHDLVSLSNHVALGARTAARFFPNTCNTCVKHLGL